MRDALAVAWKDRRREINQAKKDRAFPRAAALKRGFREDYEAAKQHTRCNRCGKAGHLARNCWSGKGRRRAVEVLALTVLQLLRPLPAQALLTLLSRRE